MAISPEWKPATNKNTNIAWTGVAIVVAIVAVFAYSRTLDRTLVAKDTIDTSSIIPISPQSQPQGPTGPLDTTSEGAPAANPRGESPPGMQSGPGSNR